MSKSKYNKYVVQELKAPFSPEMSARYAKFATRILWIDDKVVPGSFQMNCSWWLNAIEKSPPFHTHDVSEIIGFFGNDPDDPYNLHGEVEFWLGDQKQVINKTAMVFIPGGLKHCPLILKRADKPIFHFSVVTSGYRTSQDPINSLLLVGRGIMRKYYGRSRKIHYFYRHCFGYHRDYYYDGRQDTGCR